MIVFASFTSKKFSNLMFFLVPADIDCKKEIE